MAKFAIKLGEIRPIRMNLAVLFGGQSRFQRRLPRRPFGAPRNDVLLKSCETASSMAPLSSQLQEIQRFGSIAVRKPINLTETRR
jgi:hypothetical protein